MKIRCLKMRWPRGMNYCYELLDEKTTTSWLIDPANPEDLLDSLTMARVKAIVNTHHHADHSGGNSTFVNLGISTVIGGYNSPLVTMTPKDGEIMKLGDISITAIHTPCHTQDSICYFAQDAKTGQQALFTGDTLFTSGCGRFFEGTADQMISSLKKLTSLPASTVVYPGHEYTKDNVRFSKSVLGTHNDALNALEAFANSNDVTTGVFTIADELKFNPFLRLDDPNVLKATNKSSPSDIMDTLRSMKNKL